MDSYNIVFKESAKKEIRSLEKKELKRIMDQIKDLAIIPRPVNCKKLSEGQYRIRQGDYRIVYEIFDDIKKISIVKVRNRKEAYR